MKRLSAALLASILCVFLALSVFAESDGFIIENGVLTGYTGTAPVITIPDEVTYISAEAFADSTNLIRVTIKSSTCSFDPGTFSSDVIIRTSAGSAAEAAAVRDGLATDIIAPLYSVTVSYVYSDGTTAVPSYTADISDGDSYSVETPALEGYVADTDRVEGTVSGGSVYVTVTYSKSVSDGWKYEGGAFRYAESNRYLAGETKVIDGVSRTFDASGNLVLSNEFFTFEGKTYYLVDSVPVSGYRIIGSSVYCFGSDGVMLAGTSADGYTFDLSGALMGDGIFISISDKNYYIKNNTLYSGFLLIDNSVCYFGSDFAMVKSATVDGYSFDASGHLVSGVVSSDITVSKLPDVSYTGEEQKPEVTVQFKGIPLTKGIHYSLGYADNLMPGEAKVNIVGLSPFDFSLSVLFNILGEDTYTLTVSYVNLVGMSLAPAFTTEVEPGSEYSVESPEIEGYTPDLELVEGTMGYDDIAVTVTYSKYTSDDETEEATEFATETDDPEETTEPETTEEPEEEEPVETIKTEVTETTVTYDYGLILKVFIVSTIIAGVSIVLIINWDMIQKSITKRKNAAERKKNK